MGSITPDPNFQSLFEAVPGLYLALLPDAPRYTIVAVSDAYLRATHTERSALLGHGLFEAFPSTDATGARTHSLVASLRRVVANRAPDVMQIHDGWSTTHSPVFGPTGDVAYILQAVQDVSDTLERERQLAYARSGFEQASESIFVADTNGHFTDVNAAACAMLGYSRDELVGKQIIDLIPVEEVPRLARAREHLLSPGTSETSEWTLRRKDGTLLQIEVSTSILADGRWQAFVRDVSAFKRIEAELRDANASLDAIVENLPIMLFMKDCASLRFVRFNRAGEDLLGWPRGSLIGKDDFDVWPHDQAEFFVAKDRDTLEARNVVDIVEEPIQTRYNGIRFLHTRKVPILDAAGTPRYLLGISEDITDRKRREEERALLAEVSVALSTSLDYERTLATVTQLAVQHACDWCGIDVLGEHGELTRLKVASANVDDAALAAELERVMLNQGRASLARFVLEEGHPIVVEEVTKQFVERIAQGPEHLQLLRATGVTSLIGVPLVAHGNPLGVLLFGAVNHRRVYGPSDLQWATALADRAAVALENARLYRAALQATQRRDQVLGVVAHDLRNPLSTILLQISLLQARVETEHELGPIHRAATRMDRLINDLLDVTRMEAEQVPLQRARLSAQTLVAEAVELQRANAAQRELSIDVEADTLEVWGDHDRLLQVFENLIGNAIKFTAPGGHIAVGAARKDQQVVFWVADDGTGIAPDALPHVFERFWQATPGDRRGAGLGLLIVRGIVEAHGGRVWVESTLGRGSRFLFSIPTGSAVLDRPMPAIH